MARPVLFTEVDSLPDILPANRHKLMFPNIAGVDGNKLMLHGVSITIPTRGIAQIPVKYLGHGVSFRGGSTSEHVITVEFYEDSAGFVLKALSNWMNIISDKTTGGGGYKNEYAKDGTLYVFDTTGNATHSFLFKNMWPFNIAFPQLGQDSAPFQVTVQFSVDVVDLNSSYSLRTATTGKRRTSETWGNPYSDTNSSSKSTLYNLTNGAIVGLGSQYGGIGLASGVSISASGLGVGGSISLGAFKMNFGSLFGF